MATLNFYGGAGYGESEEGEGFLGFGKDYRQTAASLGVTTDPRTANQLSAVSQKISTGAKAIEVTGIDPAIFESIPEQHLKEINRLKQLTGVELTLHGPLVEPTGLSNQGWTEDARKQVERTMLSAIERSNKLDPKGNVVVTFHSSNGLPDPELKVFDEKTKKERTTELWVVDEKEGKFNVIRPKENPLLGKTSDVWEELDNLNKESWNRQLTHAAFNANQGKSHIDNPVRDINKVLKELGGEKGPVDWIELCQLYKTTEGQEKLKELDEPVREMMKNAYDNISFGEIYTKDSYNEFQTLFNQAWLASKDDKETLDRLRKVGDEVVGSLKSYEKDAHNLPKFADVVLQGINTLNTIKPPETFKPMKDFAIDKASDSFSNVALHSYKKFGDSAPIISVENPPAGMGLTRADDLKELIDASRKKFKEKAMIPESKGGLGLSESEAREQAEKILGVTWDVGHINMIRKFGFGKDEITKETEKIAPYVKHVHLSDNFGLEHTELPMGMGNVPIKKHMELINEYNDKVKKIIETGNWYQHFKTTPLAETFKAFGSPIYAMKAGPYWNQISKGLAGGYFAGYGQMLPDVNFSVYGAGFSNLPHELGGQMGGKSRIGGTPME